MGTLENEPAGPQINIIRLLSVSREIETESDTGEVLTHQFWDDGSTKL